MARRYEVRLAGTGGQGAILAGCDEQVGWAGNASWGVGNCVLGGASGNIRKSITGMRGATHKRGELKLQAGLVNKQGIYIPGLAAAANECVIVRRNTLDGCSNIVGGNKQMDSTAVPKGRVRIS